MRAAGVEAPLRTLIYIPIVHGPADMGDLREPVRQVKLRKLGRRGWEQHRQSIDELWTGIEGALERLHLAYEKVRVYQDGLPACGREPEIVSELAAAGSRNHRILLHLKGKGATIMGTESSELLIQEYQLAKQVLASVHSRENALSRALLTRRDQYIADRINDSLGPGETGILFLGALHSLSGRLAKDIRILYPIGRPLASGGETA